MSRINQHVGVCALALVLAVALPRFWPEHLHLATHILIVGLFALSLDLILGVAGILSLGHAVFFGVGAYAAGLFAKHVFPDPVLGLGVSAAAAALLGYACAPLLVRSSDLSRLMVTLGIGLLMLEAANKAAIVTGGADGLQGIAMAPLLGLWTFNMFGHTGYLYTLTVAALALIVINALLDSEFGISLRAIHDHPRRCAAIGIDVGARLTAAYVIGAALAGAAGALLAQTAQFVGLEEFSFGKSAEILVILVVGGTARRWGGFAGAGAYLVLHERLAELAPQYWNFWLGLFLVLLVMFSPNGLLGTLDSLKVKLAAFRGSRA